MIKIPIQNGFSCVLKLQVLIRLYALDDQKLACSGSARVHVSFQLA